jgi:hypothetical protein
MIALSGIRTPRIDCASAYTLRNVVDALAGPAHHAEHDLALTVRRHALADQRPQRDLEAGIAVADHMDDQAVPQIDRLLDRRPGHGFARRTRLFAWLTTK